MRDDKCMWAAFSKEYVKEWTVLFKNVPIAEYSKRYKSVAP